MASDVLDNAAALGVVLSTGWSGRYSSSSSSPGAAVRGVRRQHSARGAGTAPIDALRFSAPTQRTRDATRQDSSILRTRRNCAKVLTDLDQTLLYCMAASVHQPYWNTPAASFLYLLHAILP
ncbi:MAG: hypothetical protein NVS4B3_20160 [Gemmatimonadaceae bacterium]